jgi:molybdopterin synthase catalytic subunit
VGVEKVKLFKRGEVKLQDLVEALRPLAEHGGCGAIVAFNGVVRSTGRDGSKVLKLAYEAYEEAALRALAEVRRRVMDGNPGVEEVLIYHVVGDVKPGEDTVLIAVAAKHRREAFKAAEEALEAVKHEVALWKKEVTERGESWVSG